MTGTPVNVPRTDDTEGGKRRLRKWIVFSLTLTLLPFVVKALILMGVGQAIKVRTIFSNGELLLVTCAVAGELLSELITAQSRSNNDSRTVFLSALALVASIFAAVFYGVIAAQMIQGAAVVSGSTPAMTVISLRPEFVSGLSIVLFVPVVISAGYVKYAVKS